MQSIPGTNPSPPSKPKNKRTVFRRHPRRSVKVECRRGSFGLGRNIAVGLLDLSEDGVRIQCTEQLEAKKEVEVVLSGYGLAKSIEILGNVIWCVASQEQTFVTGIKFQKRLEFAALGRLSLPK